MGKSHNTPKEMNVPLRVIERRLLREEKKRLNKNMFQEPIKQTVNLILDPQMHFLLLFIALVTLRQYKSLF
jgi:hypothetical protein